MQDSISGLSSGAGITIDFKKLPGGRERITCLTDDVHTAIIGSTGAGKTRRMVIPTICSLALAGESMVVTDPKGEIYAYTKEYLETLGYDVYVMNFFDTSASMAYNLLQLVIDAVKENDITLAVTRAWDLTNFLVEKNDKSEPIWSNGEMSVIAAAILCVVYDNNGKPQYQNLTNVYWFLANMYKDVNILTGERATTGENAGKLQAKKIKPITEYVNALPDDHPAKPLLGISGIAPEKTAGSFYTSALTTLRLFTAIDVYNITNCSEFSLETLGQKKQVLFFILPDSKTTYYPIVTLICSQIYDVLTEKAKRQGNRLKVRVNYILDEFGNFTKIADFCTMLTVGRGYGIRFNLFLQSFSQLEEKYEKTGEMIIKDNCTWICLTANNNETLKDFETRLGEYTTTSYSVTNNESGGGSSGSRSSSVNLIGRSLLKADEIGKIKTPWLLFSQIGHYPLVTYLPDLSKWKYNQMLGLGDKKHNQKLIEYVQRHQERRVMDRVHLWGIWDLFSEGDVTLKNLKYKIQEFNSYGTEEPTYEMPNGDVPVTERGIREKRIKSNDLDGKKNRFEQIQNEAELKQQIDLLREEVRSLSRQLNAEKKPID